MSKKHDSTPSAAIDEADDWPLPEKCYVPVRTRIVVNGCGRLYMSEKEFRDHMEELGRAEPPPVARHRNRHRKKLKGSIT